MSRRRITKGTTGVTQVSSGSATMPPHAFTMMQDGMAKQIDVAYMRGRLAGAAQGERAKFLLSNGLAYVFGFLSGCFFMVAIKQGWI